MKKLTRLLSLILIVVLLFLNATSMKSEAAFNDLKRNGVDLKLNKGNWVSVYTKIPGKSGLTRLVAKITKFRSYTYPEPTSGSGSSKLPPTTTATLTFQVQIPTKLTKKSAKKLLQLGHDYIDYVDVVIVDKNSGENLNTSETSEDGTNYYGVSVSETEWKGMKPQKLAWADGTVYQYYVSYVKTVSITYPADYKRTCVGVCGTHISDYYKMIDWNEGFTKGYTVLSDSTHVKLGNKGMTKKLSHFMVLK